MLKEFLEKYKAASAEAAIVPEEVSPNVAAGAAAIKRNGERVMRESEAQYLDYVPSVLKIIAVSGTYAGAFAQFSKELIGIETIDYTGIIDRLTNNIKERTPRDAFSNQEYGMFLDELNSLKGELGVSVLTTPHFSSDDQASNLPIRDAVKLLIERTFGQDLYALVTRVQASKAAFAAKYDGEAYPVIVYNYIKSPSQFLPVPVRAAEIEQVIDKEDVSKALHGINSSLKGLLSQLKPKTKKQTKPTENEQEENKETQE